MKLKMSDGQEAFKAKTSSTKIIRLSVCVCVCVCVLKEKNAGYIATTMDLASFFLLSWKTGPPPSFPGE